MKLFEDTRPARLSDDGTADPWAEFRVEDGREIVALMRQLRDAAIPLVVSGPGGASLSTVLWALDTQRERISLSTEQDDPDLERLVVADEAVAVGYLESVKLQFDLGELVLVRGTQGCAMQARLPRTIYRFQRRGTFRVRPLARHAPVARLRHPAIPEMAMALRVIDVSGGGCALYLPDDLPPIEPGVRLHGVQVELDAETRFNAALLIHNVGSLAGGDHGHRLGCEWHGLESTAARTLQRYIDQTQKRRRLLCLD